MTKKERAAEYMAMIVAGMDATEALLQFGKECWDESVDECIMATIGWMFVEEVRDEISNVKDQFNETN